MNQIERTSKANRGSYKSSEETRQRIIEAAEIAFAEEGLNISMRRIMDDAGVNVSSINYHFGDRDSLLRALMDERSQSINQERLRLLNEALEKSHQPTLAQIIDALLRPALGVERRRDHKWQRFLKVRAMLSAESSPVVRDAMSENYNEMHNRFIDALCLVTPKLSRDEIYWRYHCLLGVQSQSIAFGHRITAISDGQVDVDETNDVLEKIIPLMVRLFE